MAMRMEDYRPAWLGFTALVVLVMAIAITLVVHSLNLGDRRVQAEFAQAAQLAAGDQVTVAGVPVGQVTGLRLDGDHVTVTLAIGKDVPLGADTTAAIKLTTLLGNRYLELAPAGTGTLPGGRIPLAHTSVPYDLQSALADATTTFDQVDADKVGQALTRLSGQLNGLPQLIPSAMANVRTLSEVIASRRDQIGALLTSTSRLTGVVHDQQQNLGVLFTQGRDLLQDIQSRRQSIETLLSASTALVHTLTPIAVNDQPEIRSLLDNLSQMMHMLGQHDAQLGNMLQILPVPWRYWANLTGTGMELDANATSGGFVDSFVCALVGRAPQLQLPPYTKDCK